MAVPPNLKAINSYLKLGKEYDKRDPTVAYFCRMFAIQRGIKLDSKSPDCKKFLFGLMDQLEEVKKLLISQGDEAVGNDIVAQAHVESVCVNLFSWADVEDRKGVCNKNVIKTFYSSSLLYDVLSQFGEISDECKVQQKYAKWKATYLHKCMQSGETPIPGPDGSGFEDELGAITGAMGGMDINTAQPGPGYPTQPGPGYPTMPSEPNQPFSYTQPPPQDRPTPVPRQSPSNPASSSYVDPGPPSFSAPNHQQVDFEQATKFCKFAMSAIQYEDVDSAVDNLKKTLNLLQPR